MAKSTSPDMSDQENRTVALGAILFAVLFFGGGALGSKVSSSTDVDTLVGLVVGTVAWVLVFGAICAALNKVEVEPLETSPFDDDQPEPEEPEDDYESDEQEPVDLDYFETEQARQADEYPTREKG